tara:strand:- start:146 stop:1231 length:1086 start_codon:yes stop_codon:yes gene_type:complete
MKSTAKRVKRKITGKSKYEETYNTPAGAKFRTRNKYKFTPSGKYPNRQKFKVGKPTKYQKRAATAITAGVKGSLTRRATLGLTIAQKRALNPVVINGNVYYNARSEFPFQERFANFLARKKMNVRKLTELIKDKYGASDETIKKARELARKIYEMKATKSVKALSAFVAVLYILKTNPGRFIDKLFKFPGMGSSLNWASASAIRGVSAKDLITAVKSIRPNNALLAAMSADPITTKLALEILATPNPFSSTRSTIGGTATNIAGVVYITLWGLAVKRDNTELAKATELIREFFPDAFVKASKALFGRIEAVPRAGTKVVTPLAKEAVKIIKAAVSKRQRPGITMDPRLDFGKSMYSFRRSN